MVIGNTNLKSKTKLTIDFSEHVIKLPSLGFNAEALVS